MAEGATKSKQSMAVENTLMIMIISKQKENPYHDAYVNAQFPSSIKLKGKTDEIVAHFDIYERFTKHILPDDRYHAAAAVMNCFDNLHSLQTYDV